MLKQLVNDLKAKATNVAQVKVVEVAAKFGFVPRQALDASVEANKKLAKELAKSRATASPATAGAHETAISASDFARLTPEQQALAKAAGLY